MRAGLLDVLKGRFHDDATLSQMHEGEHLIHSVLSNLNRVLNTRQGSIAHLPDFGLPDISSVYRDMPVSIEFLRKHVRDAVIRYEPRLKNISVRHVDNEDGSLRITFLLKAELLHSGPVRFQTTFSSTSIVRVRST